MLTDIRHNETLLRLRDQFRGVGEDWIVTTLEMLAAARLPEEQDGDFLSDPEELIERGWESVRDQAATFWKLKHGSPLGAAPFGLFATADRRPGHYEAAKQAARTLRAAYAEPEHLLAALVDLATPVDRRWSQDILYPATGRLLADLLQVRPGATVYCAFEASAVSALHMAIRGCSTTLQMPGPRAHLWASIGVAVGAAETLTVVDEDPFSTIAEAHRRRFDAAIVVPPMGLKIPEGAAPDAAVPSSGEAQGVILASQTAKNAVCLAPYSLLFRTTLSEQSFKDRLLRSHGLDTVVTLRGPAISAATNATRSILRFGHSDGDRVLMVDAVRILENAPMSASEADRIGQVVIDRVEGEISQFATHAEIAENNFNLSTDRYVLSREALRLRALTAESPSTPLGDLVDIYRPQATPPAREHQEVIPEDLAPFELTLSDIGQAGLVRRPAKRTAAAVSDLPKLRKAELQSGDIVMLIKGSIGRVGYVADIPPGEMWVASQSFAVLRLRRNGPIADPRVLFRFLDSDIAQNAIQTLRVGTVMASLQMADIRRIEVLAPDAERQRHIADQVEQLFAMQSEIAALQARISEQQKAIWPET